MTRRATPRRLAAAALDDIRRALVRLADAVLGERCTVTGERVFPADRRAHEDTQHATDGACHG